MAGVLGIRTMLITLAIHMVRVFTQVPL